MKNKNIVQLDEFDRFKLHQELEMFLPSFIFYLPQNLQLDWLHRWRDNNDKLFHPSNLVNGDVIKKIWKSRMDLSWESFYSIFLRNLHLID